MNEGEKQTESTTGSEEKKAFEKLKKEKGWDDDTANLYMQYASSQVDDEVAQENYDKEYNRLHDGEWDRVNATTDSAKTILMSPIAGVEAAVGGLIDKSKRVDKTQPTNTNSRYYDELNYTNNTRGIISEDLEKSDNGALKSFLYNIGMSTGDSAVNMGVGALVGGGVSSIAGGTAGAAMTGEATALSGGMAATVSEATSLGLMGTSSYANTLEEAQRKGLTEDKAQETALAAGVIEIASEKIPLDDLMGMAKTGSKKALRDQMVDIAIHNFEEAGEEAASEIGNIAADLIINGDTSDFKQNIKQYEAEGYSHEEAVWKATQDSIHDIALAFAGGWVSGTAMGGGVTIANNTVNRSNARTFMRDDTQTQETEEGRTQMAQYRRELAEGIETGGIGYQTRAEVKMAKKAVEANNAIADKLEKGETVSQREIDKADRLV